MLLINDNFELIINESNLKLFSFFSNEKIILQPLEIGIPINHQFSQKRYSDFSTGRYCAMKALQIIGFKDVIIPIGNDREPLWPNQIVGSISHCDILTGAIVAKKSNCISLGIDIEEIGSVTEDLWDVVFTENEKKHLSSYRGDERRVKSTIIFSIKEAFYKFQFPLTKIFLDFLDVEVSLTDFSQILVLSELISLKSNIRRNKVYFIVNDGFVISLIVPS
jgi:4'-phosphopantetheinyl transferase EntD